MKLYEEIRSGSVSIQTSLKLVTILGWDIARGIATVIDAHRF